MCNITSENSFPITKFRAFLIAQLVMNPPAMQETGFDSWVGKIPWRRDRLPIPVFLGFPCGSAGKESVCNVEDVDLISGLGRSLGEGKDYPLQYSGLENSMVCIVHGVAKNQTQTERLSLSLSCMCDSRKYMGISHICLLCPSQFCCKHKKSFTK